MELKQRKREEEGEKISENEGMNFNGEICGSPMDAGRKAPNGLCAWLSIGERYLYGPNGGGGSGFLLDILMDEMDLPFSVIYRRRLI